MKIQFNNHLNLLKFGIVNNILSQEDVDSHFFVLWNDVNIPLIIELSDIEYDQIVNIN